MTRPSALRPSLPLVLTVLLVGTVAWLLAASEIRTTRRDLVERRLVTALDLLSGPAAEMLASGGERAAILQRLRDLSQVTGLRFTLAGPDAVVQYDSEVTVPIPDLASRPEVRGASTSGASRALRTSVMTGRETLYAARRLERDGREVGVLRVATDASEIDATLQDLERSLVLTVGAALVLGVVLGFLAGWRRRGPGAPRLVHGHEDERANERAAA